MDYSSIPSTATGVFRPFKIGFPDDDLRDLQSLLDRSRINHETFENTRADRSLGITRSWMLETVEYWKNKFDWRTHEELINSFPAHMVEITDDDGEVFQVHITGLFSRKQDAVPVLLLHGWPGSFLEFLPILGNARKQYSADNLPYHLIVPSLPGFAFSSPPPQHKDFAMSDIARVLNKFTQSLGFTSYVVQGGDIGSKCARVLAAEHSACKAVHINFCIMPEPKNITSPISKQDQIGLQRAKDFHRIGSAYALEHATKPATIAFTVGSNPISLLAWVAEKFLDWTDHDLDIEDVLASVSLYWLTDCFATSIYPYRHLFTPGIVGAHENPKWYVNKPLGFSWFPKELAPIPKAWVETTGNLVFHREHDKGGHFAAVEQPLVLWQDIEDFVKQVWTGQTQ